MSITRRTFLKNGAMAVVGTSAIPSFLTRAAWGAVEAGANNKRLVVVFQRGARTASTLLCRTPNRLITRCGPASIFLGSR